MEILAKIICVGLIILVSTTLVVLLIVDEYENR